MSIKCVAVYCGAHEGKDPAFLQCAKGLGQVLLKHNIDLLYGGGCRGIMGMVGKTVNNGGGKVTGVIPKFFQEHEYLTPQQGGVGELVITEDMHSRKKYMADRADAFITLPGGFGTMEELLEVTTWVQLGIHDKPIGLLNVNNYYKGFLEWINTAIEQGFISQNARNFIVESSDPDDLFTKLVQVKKERVSKPVWSYVQTSNI